MDEMKNRLRKAFQNLTTPGPNGNAKTSISGGPPRSLAATGRARKKIPKDFLSCDV